MEARSDQWYVGWFRWSCRVLDRFVRLRYTREYRYEHGTNLCHYFRTLAYGTAIAAGSLALWAWTIYVVLIMPFTMFPLAGLLSTVGLALAAAAGVFGLMVGVLMVASATEKAPEAFMRIRGRVAERSPGFAGVVWTYLVGIKRRFCPTITFSRTKGT